MLQNYLKIAWRNLKNRKGYSFINIAGLAISIAVCFLILTYISFHWEFDRFNKDVNQIYKVGVTHTQGDKTSKSGAMEGPLAAAMVQEIPEVQSAVRIKKAGKKLVTVGKNSFYEEKIYQTDASLFNVFSFPVIQGDVQSLSTDPHSIILTKSMAEKYFPGQNPIGKTITFDQQKEYTVTTLVKDPPQQSHFGFSMLTAMPDSVYGVSVSQWGRLSAFHTYFKIRKDADPDEVLAKLNDVLKTKLSDRKLKQSSYFFLPLTDVHLRSNLEYALDDSRKGDIRYIYLFGAIGLLILFIACLNYINLSTARAAERFREVGVRKVMGAGRGYLFWQFIGESIAISIIALIVGLGLAKLFHPLFKSLLQQQIPLQYGSYGVVVLFFTAGILCTGFLAGSYPALYLSSFNPARVLKGGFKDRASGAWLRKGMLVTQFVIVVVLIMSTAVIYKQLQYVQNTNLGMEPDQVLSINLNTEQTQKSAGVLKNRLLQNKSITMATASSTVPTQGGAVLYLYPNGTDKDPLPVSYYGVDHDFFMTMGIEPLAGRMFDAIDETGDKKVIIINEAVADAMEWTDEEAIGNTLNNAEIIGVVKNFHYTSFREKIAPVMFSPSDAQGAPYLSAKLNTRDISETMDWIENEWGELISGSPFQYFFLDDAFNQLYRSERRLAHLLTVFTVIAVLIACMGLAGLVYFITSKRTKEIGIRKVLGATVSNIVGLLSKDFLKLVALGFVIAVPIAWYAMNRWLADFAYKIEIGPGIFLLAGGLALLIALATVSWQSIRAALANPVDSLRSE
jgi:putative ABC transport system permease protein